MEIRESTKEHNDTEATICLKSFHQNSLFVLVLQNHIIHCKYNNYQLQATDPEKKIVIECVAAQNLEGYISFKAALLLRNEWHYALYNDSQVDRAYLPFHIDLQVP